jgi:hypothetical protein
MSRYPTRSLSKFERFHEEPDPQSQGLRNKKWSMRAIPPPRNLGTAQTEAAGINRSHAGFPQGSITRRISNLSRLVSYLADECNRPNCQRRITTEVRTHQRRNEPSLLGTTAEGDCRVLFYRRHRPVQGCGMPAHPGRHQSSVLTRGKKNNRGSHGPRQTPGSIFFNFSEKTWQLRCRSSGRAFSSPRYSRSSPTQ